MAKGFWSWLVSTAKAYKPRSAKVPRKPSQETAYQKTLKKRWLNAYETWGKKRLQIVHMKTPAEAAKFQGRVEAVVRDAVFVVSDAKVRRTADGGLSITDGQGKRIMTPDGAPPPGNQHGYISVYGGKTYYFGTEKEVDAHLALYKDKKHARDLKRMMQWSIDTRQAGPVTWREESVKKPRKPRVSKKGARTTRGH